MLIISAPSGAGKTSLAKALVAALDHTELSVSHTTRAPRPGEQDGQDYFFVDRQTFQSMVNAGQFLEYALVFDHYYGTAKKAIEEKIAAGRTVLLDIDWQGARSVRQQMPGARSVYILPPSRQVLEDRLRSRGQDSDEVITRRMGDAVAQMRHYSEFDQVIVNDDFDAALADLEKIVRGQTEAIRPNTLNMEELLGQ
ncbi:MAG: guanylate kinase [Gammaproteobacteria bacterium]|nr:guanylate kinase [Gammaproteobacteria bacterium]